MIRITETLPEICSKSAEAVKLHCLFDSYKDDKSVLFWKQDKTDALACLADGNMTISAQNLQAEEFKSFIELISPKSIFTSAENLDKLGLCADKPVYVMYKKAEVETDEKSDRLDSRAIYDILNVKDLQLPEYPFFAVDYCKRLNNGKAKFFAKKDKCAAVSFNSGNFALMCGIASRQKGFGSLALKGILSLNAGRSFLVCCRPAVKGFYEKNGFREIYKAGYWMRK